MFEGEAIKLDNLDNAESGPASPESFEFRVPTRSSPVRIEFSAISRLHSVLSGENRSAGLLLGTVAADGVVVDDCELLPRENVTADAFFKARSEFPSHRVVGFFRTQPAGWPEMQDADREIARRCFQNPGSIFLLIQTPARRPWSAAFFDLGTERLAPSRAPGLEFFFDEYLLRSGYATALVPAAEPQTRPTQPLERRPTNWIAIGAIGALLMAAGGGYWWFTSKYRGEHAPALQASSPLSLKVVRSGKDFEVSWDRLSPALQQASGATVSIKDGELTRAIALSPKQLQEGRILYSPLFGDLTFRLEIQQGARTQAESIQVLSWDTMPPAALPAIPQLPANLDSIGRPRSELPADLLKALPDRAVAPSLPPASELVRPVSPTAGTPLNIPPVNTPKKVPTASKPPEVAKPSAAPQIDPATTQIVQVKPAPEKPAATAPLQLATNEPPTIQRPEAKPPDRAPEAPAIASPASIPTPRADDKPSVPLAPPALPPAISQQPPQQTTKDSPSASLPGPGPAQSPDPGYTPPIAVTRVAPHLTAEARRGLETSRGSFLKLLVRVTVDTAGNVQKAEVLPASGKSGFGDSLIRMAALDAARHWKFRPGTLHGKALQGDVTIEFDFQ